MKKAIFLLVLFLLLFSFSCGGGGSSSNGGSSGNHTPSISNLTASPDRATLNEGGGAITVTFKFNFIDLDGDVVSATNFYYDDNGTLVTNIIALQSNNLTSGTITLITNISTTTRKEYPGGFYVTDSGGRESNRLTGTFVIS